MVQKCFYFLKYGLAFLIKYCNHFELYLFLDDFLIIVKMVFYPLSQDQAFSAYFTETAKKGEVPSPASP